MSLPLISVTICTYGRYDLLPATIEAVLAQSLDKSLFDIWVMDNNPPSNNRTAFAARYANVPGLQYVTVDTPGLSNARNIAAQSSSARYIVYLDDDAVPVAQWLEEICQGFEVGGADAAVVGGKVLPNFAVPRPAWLHDHLVGYLSVVDWAGSDARPLDLSCEHIVGANIAFDRALLLELGGFDTKLGRQGTGNLLSGEEDTVMRAMLARNKKIYYAPRAEVVHYIPEERLTRDWFRRRAAWQGVTWQLQRTMHPAQIRAGWELALSYFERFNNGNHFINLYSDVDDAEAFLMQITVIAQMTQIMLSEGKFPIPVTL